MIDAQFLTAVAGTVSGAFGAYWTVKSFYLKRQDELKERQRLAMKEAQTEIERQRLERQEELKRFAEGETKKYAAERDFQHLMRQYEALDRNLNTLHELGDRRMDDIEADLRDIKGLLQMIGVAIGQSETGIQRYLKKSE